MTMIGKLKVLDLCSLPDESYNKLWEGHFDYDRFELVRAEPKPSEDRICELVKDADIFLPDWYLTGTPVTERVIEAGRKLRLIQVYSVGFDNVDTAAARKRGIPVANCAGINAKPVAEYTIMAALFLIKSIEIANSETHKGNWIRQQLVVPPLISLELGSLTLGILGCGSIGQEVARLARVFGTRIIYHNRKRLPAETEQNLGLEYSTFEDLLRSSDVLSINLPLTPETRGMIGARELGMMKKGAVLVNTARGGIADEWAVAEALKSGHLKGAAVDVYVNEPNIIGCPLIGLRNVILTPHSSGASSETMKRVPPKIMENLNRVYEGKPPLRVVN